MSRSIDIPFEIALSNNDQDILMNVKKAQIKERERIAQDLHDGLGYLLSTIKLNLYCLKENLDKEETEDLIANTFQLVEASLRELKTISLNLTPDVLLEYGLLKALHQVIESVNYSKKFNVNFSYFNINLDFKKNFEIALFKIVQEIINNALKHSRGNALELQLIKHHTFLLVVAEDNGKGFNIENPLPDKPEGNGLSNLRKRAAFFDGDMVIDSSSSGTTFTISFPLKSIVNPNHLPK